VANDSSIGPNRIPHPVVGVDSGRHEVVITNRLVSPSPVSRDFLLLFGVFLIVFAIWTFLELAGAISSHTLLEVDEQVLLALREPGQLSNPIGPRWLEEAMRDISALGSITAVLFVTGAVAGHLLLSRNFHALAFVTVSIAGGMALGNGLKHLFNRPRPELVPPLVQVASSSFPSGHAMLSAVVYLTLGALVARLVRPLNMKLYVLTVVLLLTFLVGVSRLYLGVHFPTDVLAGWSAGLAWAMLCWLVMRVLQKRGEVEGPREAEPLVAAIPPQHARDAVTRRPVS
jgi:undecaprenyl-diphosphatase